MPLIKPILLSFSLIIAILVWSRFRSKIFEKILLVSLLSFGGLLIMFPQLSRILAHSVGVGRGVDLIIYISIFVLGFLFLILYSKQRKLKDDLTKVVRTLAIIELELAGDRSGKSAHQ